MIRQRALTWKQLSAKGNLKLALLGQHDETTNKGHACVNWTRAGWCRRRNPSTPTRPEFTRIGQSCQTDVAKLLSTPDSQHTAQLADHSSASKLVSSGLLTCLSHNRFELKLVYCTSVSRILTFNMYPSEYVNQHSSLGKRKMEIAATIRLTRGRQRHPL